MTQCTHCQQENPAGAVYCTQCGKALAPGGRKFELANFWYRAAAYLIDSVVTRFVFNLALFPLLMFWSASNNGQPETNMDIYDLLSLGVIAQWLYYALMESGGKMGTLGKMAVRIKVVNKDGGRISFGQATARYFGRIPSALLLGIGYGMFFFSEWNQTLYDKLSSCYVVER